jgi:hypothetical protein
MQLLNIVRSDALGASGDIILHSDATMKQFNKQQQQQ